MSSDDRERIDPHTQARTDEPKAVDPREQNRTDELEAVDPHTQGRTDEPNHIDPREQNRTDELNNVAALEVDLLDPVVRSNAERLSEVLHPAFIEHGASGRIWTRQEIIDELPLEGDNTPLTTASDLVAQHLTDDVILVTYRTTSTMKTAVRSSVWLRSSDGEWQMRFHQGTPIPISPRIRAAPSHDN